jgi:hypothetical protein
MDETLDTLAAAKWFSTPCLNSGHLQVALDQNEKDKASFSGRGVRQLIVTEYDFCSSSEMYEARYEAGLVFRNVIAVCRMFEKQRFNLWKVFQRFRNGGLKLNPGKFHLFQNEAQYKTSHHRKEWQDTKERWRLHSNGRR